MIDKTELDNATIQAPDESEAEYLASKGVRFLQTAMFVSGDSFSEEKLQLYRRALQIAREREREAEPTEEESVRSILGSIPECPRNRGALENIPEKVREQWTADFIREFLDRRKRTPNHGIAEYVRLANWAANRCFSVVPPDTIEAARSIPGWQLLRRREVGFDELPAHVRSEAEQASSLYLEVFTIDGGQYFFPIPETA